MNELQRWNPADWAPTPDWEPAVATFLQSAAGIALGAFITQRLGQGALIYPAQPLRALALTPLASVRLVILGQDPYHGPGQAEGLAFSVPPGVRLPPSLRNLFAELQRDLGRPIPSSGSLVAWAAAGVLLLNTCLTVEAGQPASHARRGWEALTDALITQVAGRNSPCVFLLWGAHAQAKAALIAQAASGHASQVCVLTANHPSPLSARRGATPFIGCSHFSQAQTWLASRGVLLTL
ncbi:MAG: uracil-DNA glycosylase [Burkholderiales bacterium]